MADGAWRAVPLPRPSEPDEGPKGSATNRRYGETMVKRLDILARHHARLLDIVGTALPLITASAQDADLPGLAHLRGEMIEAMAAYQRHVHDRMSTAATDAGDPVQTRRAQAAKIGCIEIERAYQTFTNRWAHREAAHHWPEYRLSAIVMMKQVRDHVRAASLDPR